MDMSRLMKVAAFSFLIILALVIFTFTMTHAQNTAADAGIAKKLDDILKNQKTIMQGIESLKSELGIIKIRITQAQ